MLITPEGKSASITETTASLRGSNTGDSKQTKILGAAYGLADVTQKVQALFDQGAVDIFADNSVFSDSWPGNKKTLVIVYSPPLKTPIVEIAVEGERIKMAALKGM